MEERAQQQPSIKRPYLWIAGGVAIMALASGFAYGSASRPMVHPVAVVTEYQMAEPSLGGLEAAELASERRRLNRIKDHLNARERKLNRLQDRLSARAAALVEQAGLSAGEQPEDQVGERSDGQASPGSRRPSPPE